eukprot:405746-Rhodomonas_salina.1
MSHMAAGSWGSKASACYHVTRWSMGYMDGVYCEAAVHVLGSQQSSKRECIAPYQAPVQNSSERMYSTLPVASA